MIVVVGGTHHNTLSMVRCLGEKNVSPDLILCDHNGKNSYVLKSKYIHDFRIVDCAKDALALLTSQYKDSIVIVCSDDVAALLSSRNAHFMNKQRQVELAKECGFSVPISVDYLVGDIKLNFNTFPCIVKPLSSYLGGKRVDVCQNQTQLQEAIRKYDAGDTIQIQQFIRRDYEIVVDGLAVGDKVIIPGGVRKHRELNGGTSFSTVFTSDILPNKVLDSICNMVKRIRYEGLFGVEFIYSKGAYYFIEINLRNDATTYAISKAGTNLPYIYYLAKQGISYTHEIAPRLREINAIVEKRDLGFVFQRQLSFRQWLKDYKSSECRYFYSKDDKGPYQAMIKWFLNAPIRRIKRRFSK